MVGSWRTAACFGLLLLLNVVDVEHRHVDTTPGSATVLQGQGEAAKERNIEEAEKKLSKTVGTPSAVCPAICGLWVAL